MTARMWHQQRNAVHFGKRRRRVNVCISMMPAVAALSAGFAAAAFVPVSRPQGAIGTPTAAVSLFGMVPAVWADEADDEFKQIQKSVSPESEEFSQLQAPTITDPFP